MTRLVVAALVACSAMAGQPDWTASLPAGIEWTAVVGHGDTAAVLLGTSAGGLHLIDLQTGHSRLTAPICANRGVRAAVGPERDGVAYCFDRHAAYAIQLIDPVGLKWRYGWTVGADEELRDDPESMSGWMYAAVTSAGLLLVNSDGRVVLLSYGEGKIRWELELGPVPVARLHVRDNRAVVLWKARGVVRAAFLSLDQELPRPSYRDLGSTWPVWSDLVSAGLLTVAGHDLTLTRGFTEPATRVAGQLWPRPGGRGSDERRSVCPQHYASTWWTPSPSGPFAGTWPGSYSMPMP
jgi:hypothetical protein